MDTRHDTSDADELAADARGVEELGPAELRERFAKVLDAAIEQCGRARHAIEHRYVSPAELHVFELDRLLRAARREIRP